MSEHTGISWAHHTHNLWWGCEKVSPACDHCYAETLAKRYGFDVWGLDKPRRLFKDAHYNEPLGWNAKAERAGERRRVFVNSMADIGEQHPNAEMAEYLDTARHDYFTRIVPHTPWLDHLLLTKRPTNYKDILPADWVTNGCPPNVWLGITAENQHWFDIRIAALFSVPAQVYWISYEPALGEIDFSSQLAMGVPLADGSRWTGARGRIGWIVGGGESGAGFREAELDWYRSARNQCIAAGVPFWFKQHSGLHPKGHGDFLDGRQWHEVPAVLA
jgi:protein gp37